MVADRQATSANSTLPEGTVTFLFTDIEGSTKLLRRLGDKYISLLADHHQILRKVFSKWNGREVDSEGDAFFISFPRATEAVAAVVEAQRTLAANEWLEGVTVPVRMGLHTGEPWTGSSGYIGMDVHRAARLARAGHGGQVLLSETTTALLRGNLPEGVTLLDLGLHRLKDMPFPEHIRQLVISGLPSEFPPLKSMEVVEATDVTALETLPQPAFLQEGHAEPVRPLFVGRGRELAWLDRQLGLALQKQGGFVFVTGEAGLGKTSLLQAFASQVTKNVPDLLVTWGTGNAFIGRGDAYLPFRQALGLLGGDVERAWHSGTITTEQAGRLWTAIPLFGQAIAQKGQAVVASLIDGRALLSRVEGMTASGDIWIHRLRRLVTRAESNPADLPQDQLHQQCASVLQDISDDQPLLLMLDDLQWADDASLNLLLHLGKSLTASRILIVGAFRPEEVALGRDGDRHPLEKVVTELRRLGGDVVLDLEETSTDESQAFVNDLLDSEPNALDQSFRQALLAHTSGQPLFTVEMLRHLRERGDLVKNQDGIWSAKDEIGWDDLPHRVEGVVEERIGRLDDELREVLYVASVEGERFTAEVVSLVMDVEERRLQRILSRELAKRHQLVRERSAVKIGRKSLSRYQFSHALFQQYLYNDLALGERRLFHADIAAALEELYAGRTHEISIQLGQHFTKSGQEDKALPYLLQAGDQARARYAHQEAINLYQKAISFFSVVDVDPRQQSEIHERLAEDLTTSGHYEEAEIALETAVSLTTDPWTLSRLYQSITVARQRQRHFEQAYLSLDAAEEALRRSSQSPPDKWWREWLNIELKRLDLYYFTNEQEGMRSLSDGIRPIIEEYGSPKQHANYYRSLARFGFQQEHYVVSDETVASAKAAYAAAQDTDDIKLLAFNRFALAFAYLWYGWGGDLDNAEYHLQGTLDLAEEMGDVLLRTRCLNYLAVLYRRRGDQKQVSELLPKVMLAAEEGNLQEYITMAEANLAWLRWKEGELAAAKAHGQKALDRWQSRQTISMVSPFLWAALWPLIDIALVQDEMDDAVGYAQTLTRPELARLPKELISMLQQAVAAYDKGETDISRGYFRESLDVALKLGQL